MTVEYLLVLEPLRRRNYPVTAGVGSTCYTEWRRCSTDHTQM